MHGMKIYFLYTTSRFFEKKRTTFEWINKQTRYKCNNTLKKFHFFQENQLPSDGERRVKSIKKGETMPFELPIKNKLYSISVQIAK